MSTEKEKLTPEEMEELEEILGGSGYPKQEEKQNILALFKKVINIEDNTKTANLTEEELGLSKLSVRSNQEIALYCDSMGMGDLKTQTGFAGYFQKEAQITLGTSLSRLGFLLKLAVTVKKESEIKTKQRSTNKGWFKKKRKSTGEATI